MLLEIVFLFGLKKTKQFCSQITDFVEKKWSGTGFQEFNIRNLPTEVHIPPMKQTGRKTLILKPAKTPDRTTRGIHGT